MRGCPLRGKSYSNSRRTDISEGIGKISSARCDGTCGTQSHATTGTAEYDHDHVLAGDVLPGGEHSHAYMRHDRKPARAFARARPHPRH